MCGLLWFPMCGFSCKPPKKRKKGDIDGGDIIWMLLKNKRQEKTEVFRGKRAEERGDRQTGKGHSCPSLM